MPTPTPSAEETYGLPNTVHTHNIKTMPATTSLPRPAVSAPARHDIHWVSTNPSSVSRLGDVGYICIKGNWRRVCNITDSVGCGRIGVRPICPTGSLAIKERDPWTKPYVRLSAGHVRVLKSGKQEKYICLLLNSCFSCTESEPNSNDVKMNMDDLQSDLQVVINTQANRTATAFLAGPYITVRELEISRSSVTDWLRIHHSKLRKASRKTMKMWPPEKGIFAVSLCLLEFVAESWRTIFIGSEGTPSQIVVGWKPGPKDGCGQWEVLSGSSSKVNGGLGSARVCFLFRIQGTDTLSRMGLGGQ